MDKQQKILQENLKIPQIQPFKFLKNQEEALQNCFTNFCGNLQI